jgi:hypothetical protein
VTFRRASIIGLVFLCACSSASGGGDDQGGGPDASASDAPEDHGASDVATDTRPATDAAPPTDSHADVVADTGTAADTAPPCTPKTTCGGAECGKIDDKCGGILDCGDCGGLPGEKCETITPLFQTRVHNAIETLAAASPPPTYFDLADTSCAGGYKVTDAKAFPAALVDELAKKTDVVVEVDPNDGNEIRIRAATSDAAENYHVVTSWGCTAYKYTSTCTPAGF